MTELKPIKNVFAVEVPEGRDFDFRIDCNNEYETDKFCTVGMLSKNKSAHRFVEIPSGSYEILFTTKDCSEEQAATLPMEDSGKNFGYKDYVGKQSSHFYADHALQSLLRSHNLTANNYLLIKITNQEKK